MPTERIAMRRLREMLRLSKEAGLATREVARRTGVAPSTLREMYRRFEKSGLTWPLPLDLSDAELEARLYGEAGTKQGHRRRAEPDRATLNREPKKKHVALQIPVGRVYRGQPGRLSLRPLLRPLSVLGGAPSGHHASDPPGRRQAVCGLLGRHGAGVRRPTDRQDARGAYLRGGDGRFEPVFRLRHLDETLPDWIDAHVQAFTYFGGAARLLVPDNPKVAVVKACFYDPQVNRTYAEMAAHYDTAVLPARPRRSRDKAKVEAAVRVVERWLLGRLRHRRLTSLAEVNAAVAEQMVRLNEQRMLRHVGRTRR